MLAIAVLCCSCAQPSAPRSFKEIVSSPSAAFYEKAYAECINAAVKRFSNQGLSATDIAKASISECASQRFDWKVHLMERGADFHAIDRYLDTVTKQMEDEIAVGIIKQRTPSKARPRKPTI